ncbi:MAG: hypothetical protein VKN33_05195 [Candidatus Sericytochromatia bacterium]|nr:hypothetical protein [Candidatus Sericytochromatia bacterium]
MSEEAASKGHRDPGENGLAACLFLLTLGLYFLGAGGHFYASDDQQKFEALHALLNNGALSWPGGWGVGLHGQRVSWFTLGASLVMVPGYLLGGALAVFFPVFSGIDLQKFLISFQNCAISAGIVTLFFATVRRLGVAPPRAMYAALALGFATILWPYAKTSWSEPCATLFLLAGALSLWKQTKGSSPSVFRGAFFGGVFFALAVSIRLEYILAVGGMLLAATRARDEVFPRKISVLAAWLLPIGVGLAVHGVYEWLRYGNILELQNYWLPQGHLTGSRAQRGVENLYLFLLSPNQGIVWYSPLLLAGAVGWKEFKRQAPELARIIFWGMAPLGLFYVLGWGTSTWAWGLRYGYVFVPFALLPAAVLLTRARVRLFHTLTSIGLGVQLLAWPYDFGVLYRHTLQHQPTESIQLIRLNPNFSPLRLAWDNLPNVFQGASGLRAAPTHPHSIVQSVRDSRQRWVPDTWWLLYWNAPVPRSLLISAAFCCFLLILLSVFCLRTAIRRCPRGDEHQI